MKNIYKIRKSPFFYSIAYFLYGLSSVVIGNSYLFGANRFNICKVVQYVSAILFIISFCSGKLNFKQFITRMILIMGIILIAANSRNIGFGLSAISLITSLNIGAERIVRQSIRNNIIFLVIVIIPALMGFIPNDIYSHGNETAYSLGFAYYSNVPNLVLMITIFSFLIAKTRKKENQVLLGSIPFNWIAYKIGTVRLTIYLYAIFIGLILIFRVIDWNKKHRVIIALATIMYPVGAVFSIVASFLSSSNAFFLHLDTFLNDRLTLNLKGFMIYGINLFGQKIETSAENWDENFINHYFYIDCGYVYTLLSYGIIFFVLIMIAYSLLSRYAAIKNDHKLLIVCVAICIYTVINNIVFNNTINLLPIIALEYVQKSISEEKQKRKNIDGNKVIAKFPSLFNGENL